MITAPRQIWIYVRDYRENSGYVMRVWTVARPTDTHMVEENPTARVY
jgi:hypothetical protein